MYTFGQLKTEVRNIIWPEGEPEMLVVPHDKLFIEALMLIQQAVDCYKVNVTQIVPFCATYFQCGLTVFEAPRGIVRKLSTVERLDTSCAGNANSPLNFCSEIPYHRVDYTVLEKHLDAKLRKACGCGFAALASIGWESCQKRLESAYAQPDDAGLCGFPLLPLGFHFAQAITDFARPARVGVWASQHNRIYVAPWIQSTETIVLEWDGIKRDWSDSDRVENDPLLKRVVKHYVLMCHYRDYERNAQEEMRQKIALHGNPATGEVGALGWLAHQCREETRELSSQERNSPARGSYITLAEQSQAMIQCGTTTSTTTTTTSTTTTCAVPPAPTNLSLAITSLEPPLVKLTWTKNGDPNVGQEVWRSINGGPYYYLTLSSSETNEYTDSSGDLIVGQTVCYKVRGVNSCGASTFCDPACIVVNCDVPTAPGNLTVSIIEGGMIQLHWTPGNGTLSQEIWVSVNGADYTLADTVVFGETDWTDAAPPSATLCYKVRGKNECGYSDFSASGVLTCVDNT